MMRMRYTAVPGGVIYVRILGFYPLVAVVVWLLFFTDIGPFATSGQKPPIWFLAIWIVIVLATFYFFIYRMTFQLESDGLTLSWQRVLQRGEIPVSEVTGVRFARFNPRTAIITLADGKTLSVQLRGGFSQFMVDGVFAQRPSAFDAARFSRMEQRTFGSGYRRLS